MIQYNRQPSFLMSKSPQPESITENKKENTRNLHKHATLGVVATNSSGKKQNPPPPQTSLQQLAFSGKNLITPGKTS